MANLYLAHHGIKGMKWGVRRFQNDDGTLTAAGRERYGGTREYKDTSFRRSLTGSNTIRKMKSSDGKTYYMEEPINATKSREYGEASDKYARKSEEARNRGRFDKASKYEAKSEKYKSKSEAFRKLNLDRIAYDSHTSTGKLFAQNALTGAWCTGELYRDFRAMGMSRGKSFVRTMTGGIGYGSTVEKHYRDAE